MPSNPQPTATKRKPGSTPPKPGEVINYSYLWDHEYRAGRDEGVKDRPVAVVLTVQASDGLDHVYVVPMSTRPPLPGRDAIEVPAAVRRQLGLSGERSWIVVSEWNRFTWPGYDIRPIPGRGRATSFGFLPSGLFRQLRDRIVAAAIARPIDRDE